MTDETRATTGHHGKPFGMVDPDVIRDPTLGWATKLVYTHLATYCAGTRTAFPSRSRIAAELGISVRSVDAGLREGRERSLIDVEPRTNPGGDWSSNLYRLKDFGKGFRGLGGSAGDAPPSAGRAPGSARRADEVDHPTRPPRDTSSTSGDEVASSGPRTSSATRMKIHLPADFDSMPAGRIAQQLITSSVGAARDAGFELSHEAKSEFGKAIKSHVEHGTDRRDLAGMVQTSLNAAARGEGEWAWICGYPRAA